VGLVVAEGQAQHLFGVFQATEGDDVVGNGRFFERLQGIAAGFRLEFTEGRDLPGQALDVLVAEFLCGLVAYAALTGDSSFVPVVVAISLVGFLGSTTVARFVRRGTGR